MEFDLLVRKYLRGTLSPSELERLRDLLERVPEYRAELRQILELRSIIHDDALRLIPPAELSDGTRERVGARFAGVESLLQQDASRLAIPGDLADATRTTVGELFAAAATTRAQVGLVIGADDVEEEPKKRRAAILPYRIVGRALLAASFAVMVALAPTLLTPTLETDTPVAGTTGSSATRPGGGTGASSTTDNAIDGGSSTIDAPLVDAPAVDASLTTSRDEVTPLVARSQGPVSTDVAIRLASALGGDAVASAATTVSMDDGTTDAIVIAAAADTAVESERAIVFDPENPLTSILPRELRLRDATYNPAVDTAARRPDAPAVVNLGPSVIPGLDDGRRMVAVGVTLGSGNVMDADAPAALMQNSYYFSFSVSTADRIGVEMGGSTFMQETTVPDKRPVGNIFTKQGAGDTSTVPTLRNGVAGAPTTVARMKQDITYGGVFYDRRLEVDRDWDICGRVTFGAADGALVTGVRAYTAFTPTKNVTLTLGIGGSTLFNLTSRTEEASTNYGLYYGIETGF